MALRASLRDGSIDERSAALDAINRAGQRATPEALREQIARQRFSGPAPKTDQFTDDHFQQAARLREWTDAIELCQRARRWRVSVDVRDASVRTFFLSGDYETVWLRAKAIFVNPASIAIEPAGLAGGEVVDARLSIGRQIP